MDSAERKALKARAPGLDRDQRDQALGSIVEKTRAEEVQHIGKVFVLYRKKNDE